MTEQLSKSEQKRRFKQVETAAAELSLLSDNDLARLPASEALKAEIVGCRTMKGGARKRQVKYLAKIMREESVEEILAYLAANKGSKLKENRLHQEVERLRDLLVNEVIDFQQEAQQQRMHLEMDWPGESLLAVAASLAIPEGELRSSLYQYARTRGQNHYREVFRMIKAAQEKKARQ